MIRPRLATLDFWVDVGERAVRSFAQGTLVSAGIGAGVPGVSIDWATDLLAGGSLAAVTVLMCFASIPIPNADPHSGSFLPENAGAKMYYKLRKM